VRILIDECVNPRLREAFPEHEVVTAVTTGWRQILDHRLVDAIQGKFDVLVTIDRALSSSITLTSSPLGL
jgi:predicted nuclease of predicted toxin-antitoxin system